MHQSFTTHGDPAALDVRRTVRRAMRHARATLSAQQRQHDSDAITHHVMQARLIKPQSRIAAFASLPHEPDSTPLLRLAARRRALVYLPRIEHLRAARMSFAPVTGQWRINQFGIVEPAGTARITAAFLDVIFVPLLAFDGSGSRLGMGGGYYDRALAFRRRRRRWLGPRLIGLAFDMQEVPHLPAMAHDVRLDAIATPGGIRWF